MGISKLSKIDKYSKIGRFQSETAASISGSDYTATPGNGYSYYTFTSPGTANASPGGLSFANTWDSSVIKGAAVGGGGGGSVSVNFLIVAGGGGGQNGGGGAGGVVISSAPHPMSGPVSISVGSGGTRWIPGSPSTNATRGGDSSFGSITAKGGGAGGSGSMDGGNGGGRDSAGWSRVDGGPGTQPAQNPGISNITQYGNPGGNGAFYTGGGGGGGGAAGENAQATGFTNNTNQPSFGGNGQPFPLYTGDLIGLPSITPYQGGNGSWAGGGGGGSGRDGWVNNKGEADKPPHVPGGGGKASDNDGSNQKGNTEAGIDGLGGGGGGNSNFGGPTPVSKDGGNGIVIIRTG